MRRIIYPGTFDPITHGHRDLVRRALTLFDEVVVAVAASPRKSPWLDLQTRVSLAQEVLADLPGVSVLGFDGLLVDLLKAQQAHRVLRGVRGVADFEYEAQLAALNKALLPEMETVFLTPDAPYSFIASSLVRDVASHGGDISAWVHPCVVNALKKT